MSFRYSFADLRQHLTLSIVHANFQNGDQQKTSNTDDERVYKFQLQRPSNKEKFRDHFGHAEKTTSVTVRNYTLVSSGNVQLNTHTRAILLWPQPAGPSARPGLRPVLYCLYGFKFSEKLASLAGFTTIY